MSSSHLKRFVIGGLGGLAPVVALLVAVDFEKNYVNASNAQLAGYIVRTMALFAIGGFVAWLHESEVHNFKIFEIGLGAPALIAGFVTSQSLSHGPLPSSSEPQPRTTISWNFLPAAHAEPVPDASSRTSASQAQSASVVGVARGPDGTTVPIKNFTFPTPSVGSDFLEGLAGFRTRPKDVYYVITGSTTSKEDAVGMALRINKQQPNFRASVYEPFGSNPYWAVVIGERATIEEARDIRRQAIGEGLASDTYLWTLPGYR